MQPSSGAPTEAECALHPRQPATGVCARCGNFMCRECSEDGRASHCPACRELEGETGFPFTRDDFSFARLFDHVLTAFKREWLMVTLSVVVMLAANFGASMVTTVVNQIILVSLGLGGAADAPEKHLPAFALATGLGVLLSFAVSLVVQGVVLLGQYRLLIDVLDGKKADLSRMFTQVSKVGRFVALNLILVAAVLIPFVVVLGIAGVGAVFASGHSLTGLSSESISEAFGPQGLVVFTFAFTGLVVYMFWLIPLWMFAVPELVVSDVSATEALGRAWEMARGLRWAAIGYAMMESVIVMVGVVACCVGMIPAMGLAYMLALALFLAARAAPTFPARLN